MDEPDKQPADSLYPSADALLQPRSVTFSSGWTLVIFLGLPLTAVVLSFLLVRTRPPADRAWCAVHLMSIVTALDMYAIDYDGQLPPRLEVLATGPRIEYLEPRHLTCSRTRKPCVYIPCQDRKRDAKNVLIYEPLGNRDRKGGHVLFVGGKVEWLPPDEHPAAIARTMANLEARAATQPATITSQPCP